MIIRKKRQKPTKDSIWKVLRSLRHSIALYIVLFLVGFLVVANQFDSLREFRRNLTDNMQELYKDDVSQLRAAKKQFDNFSFKEYCITIKQKLLNALAFKTLPTIHLDIKQRHGMEIEKLKEIALGRGVMSSDEKVYYPATMYTGFDDVTKVKIRLKGDNIDHMQNPLKTSFRVKSKKSIFGMKKFSIQAPKTRGYWGEIFFLEMMRQAGVLAPRSYFVEVKQNGHDIGIMNMEEAFSKELLESQQRKESVILSFDENKIWEWWRYYLKPPFHNVYYTNHKNTYIDAFGMGKVSRTPTLLQDYKNGVSLLRGYIDGTLKPDDVFDYRITANFFAMAHILFSSSITKDGLLWNNMRFYYNPLKGKIEPISYDNHVFDFEQIYKKDMYYMERFFGWKVHTKNKDYDEWHLKLFKDPKFRKMLDEAVVKISDDILYTDKYDHVYALVNQHYYPLLREEFPNLPNLDVTRFKERVEFVRDYFETAYDKRPKKEVPEYDLSVLYDKDIVAKRKEALRKMEEAIYAYDVSVGDMHRIEVMNPLDYPVVIKRVYAEPHKSSLKKILPVGQRLPLEVSKTPLYEKPVSVLLDVTTQHIADDDDLFVQVYVPALDTYYDISVRKHYSTAAQEPIIPHSTIEDELKKHDFLTYEDEALQVKSGDWHVKGYIIVPEGVELHIPAGTSLSFEGDGGVISHGPIAVNGTKAQPVILTGVDNQNWKGVAVLGADKESRMTYVDIYNLKGMSYDSWKLTGGITFYQSDVSLAHVTITNSDTEDALNIVHSNFHLDDVHVTDTISDGFDSDFSKGDIIGGSYTNIGTSGGGDGIDFSGSEIYVEGTHFDVVDDKAVSVGEGSHLIGKNLMIRRAGVGMAAKDGSTIKVSESTIKDIGYSGLMAYQKKSEYPRAQITAGHLTFENVPHQAKAQKGNPITIDGDKIYEENIDVDHLYQTLMKKGG